MDSKTKIAIIGLGYVRLPICVAFSKYFKTFGYDIKKDRIRGLN
jgi:UDP-N-acetyl-D-glucosamine/UDP-N-acetyl-D-galactosamine dehydrogenase